MASNTVLDDSTAARLFGRIAHATHEIAVLGYLDARHRLLGLRHLSGARSWLALPIRLIARDVLAFDARAVVLAHNHPSGDPSPSRSDLAFTRRLALCLDALDVPLLDHYVLARTGRTSLRELGLL